MESCKWCSHLDFAKIKGHDAESLFVVKYFFQKIAEMIKALDSCLGVSKTVNTSQLKK